MWTSVALAVGVLSLVPAQSQKLKIAKAQLVYANFPPAPWAGLALARPNAKYLPGDVLGMIYEIENASVDKNTGKVAYSLLLELYDNKGTRIYRNRNARVEALNVLNSPRQPSYATVRVGSDQAPGKYKIKITVVDAMTEKKASLEREFEILKPGFGFIRVAAPAVTFIGTAFEMNFTVVGFKKDDKKRPRLTIRMVIYDDKGTSTLVKAIKIEIPKDLSEETDPEKLTALPFPITFIPNRAGKFTIKVEVKDHNAGKDKKPIILDYKFTVLDPRKFTADK